MRVATLEHETDFDGWRRAARDFRSAGVRPGEANFRVGQGDTGLFDEVAPAPTGRSAFSVPKASAYMAAVHTFDTAACCAPKWRSSRPR